MNDDQILEKIKQRLGTLTESDVSSIEVSTALRSELGLNSLDAVELVLELEEAFDIELPDDQLAGFEQVGDVIDAIKGALSGVSGK